MMFQRFSFLGLVLIACIGTASSASTPTTLPSGFMLCPKISELHKDPKMIWMANGGWKSFSPSFSTQIGQFLGAQWQGVNVGTVSCIYKGTEQMAFPIVLQYNNLVFAPSGGKWGPNLGGYINCKSTARADCAFKPQVENKPGNIYQQVDQLKQSGQQEMGY